MSGCRVWDSGPHKVHPLCERQPKPGDGEQLPITAPHQARVYPFFGSGIEVAGWVLTPIGYTISRRYAADFFGCCFGARSISLHEKLGSLPARAASVARREVEEEDGVPSRPKQMVVKVGSSSSGDTFELKGAEWVDVKEGSHDAARERPKYAIAAA
eukprot:scaffold54283_cov73-Phaeocystis_antarctica.AAC.1